MKLTYNNHADFPTEGIATRTGKLAIIEGTEIDSIEIQHGTLVGQQLQTQSHLVYQQPDYYTDRDRITVLFSGATKEDVVNRLRAGVEVSSADLWLDALPRQSGLRKNFKVEGLFL